MLVIKGLPPVRHELNPNSRYVRMKVAEVTHLYRHQVKTLVQAALGGKQDPPLFARAVMEVQFWFPDRLRRDSANLLAAFKPGVDALVDAGVLPDDGPEIVPAIAAVWRHRPEFPPQIAVVVIRLGDEPWYQEV